MSEESPTRPGALFNVPPVDVAAARRPSVSGAFALHDQVAVVAERHAMLGREALGAFADKVNVLALLQHLARGANGIADALHAAHAAGAQRGAIHQERVELHAAVAIEEAATAGVEGVVFFQYDDGFFDRIERRAAAL